MQIFKKSEKLEVSTEIEELKETIQNAHMPEYVEKAALTEVGRISKMGPSSAEYTIGVNYIDYLVSLPWNRVTEDFLDLKTAQSILDEEHYGLSEIKDRILEFLAVRILKASRKYKMLVVDDEKMTRMNLEHVSHRFYQLLVLRVVYVYPVY